MSLDEIAPDYDKPLVEVYTDIARLSLTREGHELDFLGFVVRRRSQSDYLVHEHVKDLPSWVPEWTFQIGMYPLVKKSVSVATPHDEDHGIALYHADYGTDLQASIEGKYLHLHGVCIDSVTQLSAVVNDFTGSSTVKDWVPSGTEATATYPSTG